MSKKNKNKFKKILKSQALNQITQTQTKETPVESKNEPIKNAKEQNFTPQIEIQNLPQIRADLIKTGVVVASFAIMIAGLTIADGKYHILSGFGATLFKVLHIN